MNLIILDCEDWKVYMYRVCPMFPDIQILEQKKKQKQKQSKTKNKQKQNKKTLKLNVLKSGI